jgi:hypothetical protein
MKGQVLLGEVLRAGTILIILMIAGSWWFGRHIYRSTNQGKPVRLSVVVMSWMVIAFGFMSLGATVSDIFTNGFTPFRLAVVGVINATMLHTIQWFFAKHFFVRLPSERGDIMDSRIDNDTE